MLDLEGMADVAAAIRQRIAAGTLPKDDCLVVWFSPGRGQRCAACDRRIPGREMVIHCEPPDRRVLPLHGRCYALWHRTVKGEPVGEPEEP